MKGWSTTQGVIALSSGEAEYYAMVKATSQAIGLRSLLGDMGVEMGIILKTDASAAKGIASRKGVGKVRHIEVNQLWLQDWVAKGDVLVVKVQSKMNVADALTKYVDGSDMHFHVGSVGGSMVEGRHELMPMSVGLGLGSINHVARGKVGQCTHEWHECEHRVQCDVSRFNVHNEMGNVCAPLRRAPRKGCKLRRHRHRAEALQARPYSSLSGFGLTRSAMSVMTEGYELFKGDVIVHVLHTGEKLVLRGFSEEQKVKDVLNRVMKGFETEYPYRDGVAGSNHLGVLRESEVVDENGVVCWSCNEPGTGVGATAFGLIDAGDIRSISIRRIGFRVNANPEIREIKIEEMVVDDPMGGVVNERVIRRNFLVNSVRDEYEGVSNGRDALAVSEREYCEKVTELRVHETEHALGDGKGLGKGQPNQLIGRDLDMAL